MSKNKKEFKISIIHVIIVSIIALIVGIYGISTVMAEGITFENYENAVLVYLAGILIVICLLELIAAIFIVIAEFNPESKMKVIRIIYQRDITLKDSLFQISVIIVLLAILTFLCIIFV